MKMAIEAIDTHHHFWQYDPVEYSWIGENSVLRRDFGVEDLQQRMQAANVTGAISVQVRQTPQETEWLHNIAEQHDWLKGVVGWAPFCDADVVETLDRFRHKPKLKGYRHVIQDEPDGNFILRPDFNEGIRKLLPYNTIYEILIYERHLPQSIRFVDMHPNQIFVLDHIAKPRIKDGAISPWRENMLQLAKRPNLYCKVSGIATEADWSTWTDAQLAPYLDTALQAFGPNGLMFGSDWPVLELASTYQRWNTTVRTWIAKLSEDEQTRILRGTAIEAYRL